MTDPFHDEPSRDRFERLEQLLQTTGATAIVGSGASAAAGMPTWPALFSQFCRAARGAQAAELHRYNVETVVRRLQELRLVLGDETALRIVKDSFDRPVDALPETYRLVADTFRRVVTTNYDNFLMTVALLREADPSIEIYPEVKVESRYYYLHGHAGTAKAMADLVLCEREYDDAYNQIEGEARVTLRRLMLDGPVRVYRNIAR